jgi:GT2 family glycosyltransferase
VPRGYRTMPQITVVIPSKNRPEAIRRAAESVLAGTALPAELVIVDQTHEAHAELSSDPRLRYLHTPGRGVSAARNAGIRAATHDHVALIDDDMIVTPTWLADLSEALDRGGPQTVVVGRVIEQDAADLPSTESGGQTARVHRGRIGLDVLYANMGLHKDAFARAGLFDERLGPGVRFGAAEDNDLCFRLLESGHEIQYAPWVVVVHVPSRSAAERRRQRWNYAVGQGAFYAKHASLSDRYMLAQMWADVRQRGGAVLSSAASPRRLPGAVLSLVGLLTGFAGWLVLERRGGAATSRPDA